MSNTSSVALKDLIYKLQLCLLEGIKSETQLLVAGSLLSKSDYNDVVTERTIAQLCGYPLCINILPSSEPLKKGRYGISLKEHKVYDLLETRMYCSTKCVVNSRAYGESLQDDRSLDFDSGKIDKVMKLFEGLNLKAEEGLVDFGLGNLSIKEKEDQNVVLMEESIGPSNAIEGYVPRNSKNRSRSKVEDEKLKRDGKEEESELNFTSIIITQEDGYSKPSAERKTNKKHTNLNVKEESKIRLKSCLKLEACSGASAAIKRNVTWADDDNDQTQVEIDKQVAVQNVASVDIVPVSEGIAEPALLKWPGIVESEDSWFDSTPDEFVVDLSPFATMFMSLFAWVSSSTLAYVYGGENSFDYASVNGREYPEKIVLSDGRSSEIKQTLAACLARALPGLVLHLRLATPLSTIESGMGCLLETMSFVDPVPALRMKQWHVFLLLFLEALSVSRIPALAPILTTNKVLEDGRISREEYEVLKDFILPLGRLATQSGA